MKTILKVVRNEKKDSYTGGGLFLDGLFECYTLERPEVQILPGTYKITLYSSPIHGYKVPLLHDVPGRLFIEIHVGNYPRDTKGCILVGTQYSNGVVMGSKLAFDKLMTKLEKSDDIEIIVA